MSKVTYQPYKTFLIDHTKQAMVEFGFLGKKETLDPERALYFNASLSKERKDSRHFGSDITDWVIMSEYRFLKSDRFTIFPSSKDVLDTIMRSKLNITDVDSVIPPAESFVVMMPQGYKTPAGVPLRPFLVQWATTERNCDAYQVIVDKVSSSMDFNRGHGGVMIDVIGIDSELLAIRSSCYGHEVIKTLNASDVRELDSFRLPENLKSLSTSEQETEQLQAMLKIAVGLAVFDSAYDDFLVKGIPQNTKVKKVGLVNLDNARTIGQNLKPHRDTESKTGHVRGFHFRQLRDKRYYQGEHANKPIGSRHVPVSESWVGDKIDSHVTNDKGISQ